MSDKETAPWIRKAAETIQRKYNPFSGGIQQLIEIIEKLFAVECRAPAPQPEKCGQRFTCAATGLRIYVCALEKGHEGDCDDHPTRGLAATPQVTPADDLTPEEAKSLAEGLMDFAEGRTRPFSDIQKEMAETIDDGLGKVWSAYCHECGQKSMYVCRPGSARCKHCYDGAPYPDKAKKLPTKRGDRAR